MKQLIVLAMLMAGLSGTVCAQATQAVIKFEKLVHDYGAIRKGTNGKCVFKFTNTGKEPLIITDVKSSCGCTIPEWPMEPIMPGQQQQIEVDYDTKRIGAIDKKIAVMSNASESTVTLQIKGTVIGEEGEEGDED